MSLAGEIPALVAPISCWPEFQTPPMEVRVDDRPARPLDSDWTRHVQRAKRRVDVRWTSNLIPLDELRNITVRLDMSNVMLRVPGGLLDETDILDRVLPLPFRTAAVSLPDVPFWTLTKSLFPDFSHHVLYSGHCAAGLACLFRGAGHEDVLVSRRWLDHGPWYTESLPDDTTYVQLCDLTADPETMVAQSIPAEDRLGYSDTGGVFKAGFHVFADPVRGLYVPEDGTFRIVCAEGRVVSQREMLDAAGLKKLRRRDPKQPISQIRYIFVSPADARAHLHELWLRELECWTFDGDSGKEVRLDADYHPTPQKPAWVARVAEQRARR